MPVQKSAENRRIEERIWGERVQSSFLLPLNPKTLAIVSVRYGVISFGRENKVIKEIRNSFKVSSS